MNRLSIGYSMKLILTEDNLKRLKYLINDENNWETYNDSNNIIELYILSSALKDNKSQLSKRGIFYDQNIYGNAIKTTVTFFNSISFESIFKSLDVSYIPYFWHIISKYKIEMDHNTFHNLSKNKKFSIVDILRDKRLSSIFGDEIINYVLENPEFVGNIITDIAQKNDRSSTYHYPEKLKSEYMDKLVNNYLELPNINTNALYFLINSRPHTFKISKKTYIKAIKKQESIYKDVQNSGINLKNEFSIIFGDENKIVHNNSNDLSFSVTQIYDKKLLFGNMTYEHLLGNFQSQFDLVDKNNMWTCVSNINNINVLERFLVARSKNDYVKGMNFDYVNMSQDTIVEAYSEYLSKNNINIEKIIKSYFELSLPKHLNINGFYFNPSSKNTTYLEKCRNLLIEQESLLHQFQFYYDFGEVSKKYIGFVSGPIDIESVPSFINDKYIYYNSKHNQKTYKIISILFSDQNNCLYDISQNPKYNTTYKVLSNYKANVNKISNDYDMSSINFLIDCDIIQVNNEGFISFNESLLFLMNQLYFKDDLLNSTLIRTLFKNEIEFLKEHDIISFGNKLLSPTEQKYFKFMLNNQDFTNSRMIRNSYIHGNSPENYNQVKRDYFTILRITILIILKMNLEFVYKKSIDKII